MPAKVACFTRVDAQTAKALEKIARDDDRSVASALRVVIRKGVAAIEAQRQSAASA